MIINKKLFGKLISMLLLLSFSVTILPLDVLHTHQKTGICAELKQTGSCHHKLHLTEKSSYCWLCAIHYDKLFTISSPVEKLKYLPFFSVLSENEATSYFAEIIFSYLRGPPQN